MFSVLFFFFVNLSFPSPSEFHLQHQVGVVLCLEVCRILIVHPQSLKRQENMAMAPLGLSRRKERIGPYKTRRGCSWDYGRGRTSARGGNVCTIALWEKKNKHSKQDAGCSVSAAGETTSTMCERQWVTLTGSALMKHDLCFSCLRMRVQFEFVQCAVRLRCVWVFWVGALGDWRCSILFLINRTRLPQQTKQNCVILLWFLACNARLEMTNAHQVFMIMQLLVEGKWFEGPYRKLLLAPNSIKLTGRYN